MFSSLILTPMRSFMEGIWFAQSFYYEPSFKKKYQVDVAYSLLLPSTCYKLLILFLFLWRTFFIPDRKTEVIKWFSSNALCRSCNIWVLLLTFRLFYLTILDRLVCISVSHIELCFPYTTCCCFKGVTFSKNLET